MESRPAPSPNTSTAPIIDFNSAKIRRYNRIRHWKDRIASGTIALGGIGVLSAILLIFLYLFYEILPMFTPASVTEEMVYPLPAGAGKETLYLTIEEQNETGLRVTTTGRFLFFNVSDGSDNLSLQLPLAEGVTIASFSLDSDDSRFMVFGLSDGTALVARHQYRISYPEGNRVITPWIEYPYGETPMKISSGGFPLTTISMRQDSSGVVIVADDGHGLAAVELAIEERFDGEVSVESSTLALPQVTGEVRQILVDFSRQWAFVLVGGKTLHVIDIKKQSTQMIALPLPVQHIRFLLGGISLLVASHEGTVSQWFMVRDADGNSKLTRIRQFESKAKNGLAMALEPRRKAFATVSDEGYVELFHATAERKVFSKKLLDGKPLHAAFSPRANKMLVLTEENRMHVMNIDNRYPEVSWSSLWGKLWYESYPEPDYIWQSSASNNDFEPKFSLTPLAFGTLKAAFYAMLLGAPLAIFGAIYTAYFMTPVMRGKIKPLIELMAALPTVIIGFLAGLWLAPFMEHNLLEIFTLFIVMPPAVVLFAWCVSRLPVTWQNRINDGWHGLILIPVIILVGFFCFMISPSIEAGFFGGDIRHWLTVDLGIPFDQRNALVVGVAMGFAVIPGIFSIAEDAIFSVPKHLSYGSLALGATPWQTLTGVVLPTASPGIFSGLMIGLGRAVGETMIVLMATGNTPIMDANIFEGMRTLASNIAVEIPETEVNSTHYRILFLAAFVLFTFTFVVNTGAEMIRHNLRKKYGSL